MAVYLGTNTATTPAENSAIQQITNNAGSLPQGLGNLLSPQVTSLINGNYGTVPGALSTSNNTLTSLIPGLSNLNPSANPTENNLINTITQDAQNSVGSQFAGAGRALSPGEAQAETRGITQGLAPTLFNQYNSNISNLLGTIQQYMGQNVTGNNTTLGNLNAGVGNASNIPTLNNLSPLSALAASNLGFTLPLSQQGEVLNQLLPIAGLGGQTQASGSSNTSQTASPLAALTSAGGLFSSPAGGTSGAAGMLGTAQGGINSLASGVGGLLAFL